MSVGALAMCVSLFLPQTATVLLVLLWVAAIAFVNLLSQLGTQLGGVAALLDRYGPPLGSAIVVSLAPWIESVTVSGHPLELALRLALWALACAGLLVLAFRSSDLGR